MKKNYFIPQTMCLKVNMQTVICASAGAPARQGQLGKMTVVAGQWS